MSEYTKEWQPYKGFYKKEFYDIRLASGEENYGCWPNAGFFCPLSNKNTKPPEDIHEDLIVDIRISPCWPCDEEVCNK